MSALLQDPADLESQEIGSTTHRLGDQIEARDAASDQDQVVMPPPGYSGVAEPTTAFHTFLEHTTTLLFPILFVPNFYFPLDRLYELELLWLGLLAIPIALVLGDFIGGLVHWVADTYFSEDTPILGQALIRPFRQHHIYPRDITTHNLVSIVGNVCILAVPVLSLCLYLLWISDHPFLAFVTLCTALMVAATVATNLFHKWAHQERPVDGVRWLQRARLVLEPRHHQLHHTEPFNMHYCITNGWLNPFLNRIGFFRKLEAMLKIIGIQATRDGSVTHVK